MVNKEDKYWDDVKKELEDVQTKYRNDRAERKAAHNGFLAEALLEVRELVPSGSEAMHIIDEALGKAGLSPFPIRHPDCKGRRMVHTIDEVCDHCRNCGGFETDPDGLCEICLKCSRCCEDGTFADDDDNNAAGDCRWERDGGRIDDEPHRLSVEPWNAREWLDSNDDDDGRRAKESASAIRIQAWIDKGEV